MKIREIIEKNSEDALSELFHNPGPWRWEKSPRPNNDSVIAFFKIEDHEYSWSADRDPDDPGTWLVEFESHEHGYKVAGTGNASQVFSTVIDITQSFLRNTTATTLAFFAKEPSRKKLYLSLVRRLLPTWKLTTSGDLFTVVSPYKGTASDYYSESATAGATSTANIGTVVNPHISPGPARGKKSYLGSPWGGKSGTKSPPQPKVVQPKNPNGTAKGAHDIKGASLFGGPAIKR